MSFLLPEGAPRYHPDSVYAQPLDAEQQEVLRAIHTRLQERCGYNTGYPCNQVFAYSDLYPFLDFSINNVGDPFHSSNFSINTHEIECEVLQTFARLTHAPEEDFWGYVNNGGTEGNMYGLYLAREVLSEGMVYYSEASHYSVAKILRMLNMHSIMIRCLPSGEIDYEDLYETLRIRRDVPPILMANIGTTMTGAVDDLEKIQKMFSDLAIQNHYIHCDAAFHGMILPFVDHPPPFDFRAGIDSIAISGHKLIGAPIPCGVVLARKGHVNRVARAVEYVGVIDTTLSGSRNAWTPLLLWYAWARHGADGFRAIVKESIDRADYAIDCFAKAGVEAWRNPNSPIVVFPAPAPEVIRKWQLATHNAQSHLITLPHVSREAITQLVQDAVPATGEQKMAAPT